MNQNNNGQVIHLSKVCHQCEHQGHMTN